METKNRKERLGKAKANLVIPKNRHKKNKLSTVMEESISNS